MRSTNLILTFRQGKAATFLMNDSYNGTYSDENDVENDASDGNGGAMMSIFASYYGIEDDVKSRRPPGDLIDSAHFDSNAYVKVFYHDYKVIHIYCLVC